MASLWNAAGRWPHFYEIFNSVPPFLCTIQFHFIFLKTNLISLSWHVHMHMLLLLFSYHAHNTVLFNSNDRTDKFLFNQLCDKITFQILEIVYTFLLDYYYNYWLVEKIRLRKKKIIRLYADFCTDISYILSRLIIDNFCRFKCWRLVRLSPSIKNCVQAVTTFLEAKSGKKRRKPRIFTCFMSAKGQAVSFTGSRFSSGPIMILCTMRGLAGRGKATKWHRCRWFPALR